MTTIALYRSERGIWVRSRPNTPLVAWVEWSFDRRPIECERREGSNYYQTRDTCKEHRATVPYGSKLHEFESPWGPVKRLAVHWDPVGLCADGVAYLAAHGKRGIEFVKQASLFGGFHEEPDRPVSAQTTAPKPAIAEPPSVVGSMPSITAENLDEFLAVLVEEPAAKADPKVAMLLIAAAKAIARNRNHELVLATAALELAIEGATGRIFSRATEPAGNRSGGV